MTASRFAALAAALLLTAGCSKNTGGGPGDTGTTDCKLVGEWQGTLKFLAVNGLQLPPTCNRRFPAGCESRSTAPAA